MDHSDVFHTRLGEEPHERYIENLRVPEFKILREEFFEPIMALNEAHVVVLEERDLISNKTAAAVLQVLDDHRQTGISADVDGTDFSDIHFHIEKVLIDELGNERGGILQTGRSRNDLYDAAVRINMRQALFSTIDALENVRSTVLDLADATTDVITTSYTHSQPGQPITLAHYFLSFDHVLERDVDRLRRAYNVTNESPLGSAVTGGTGFDIDRERLAELTGFQELCYNTYDATASMDYIPEATNSTALLMTNVSRLARDLIDWSTHEYSYIEISGGFSSVSSMMPQKKNPYPLEKLRTSASDSIGAATSSMTHLKGSPYGDVSEVAKYAFLPLLTHSKEVVRMLGLLEGILDTLELKTKEMRRNAAENFSTMTELADTIVRQENISFRQAHQIVGGVVRRAFQDDRTANEIKVSDLNAAAENVLERELTLSSEDLALALDPQENVERRNGVGGTAPECNEKDLQRQYDCLDDHRNWLLATSRFVDESEEKRRTEVDRIVTPFK